MKRTPKLKKLLKMYACEWQIRFLPKKGHVLRADGDIEMNYLGKALGTYLSIRLEEIVKEVYDSLK